MKYRKQDAKGAAREILKGIWTAMPYSWTAEDEFDEAANRANMERIIADLHIDGHYCSGNIAEFWSMPDAERMRARISGVGPTKISEKKTGDTYLFRVRLGPVASVAEADRITALLQANHINDVQIVLE